jgi:DNA modification methylase
MNLALPSPRNIIARIAEIRPYSRNTRTHSPYQIEQIVASIREFGFTNPVLVDEQNTLIAGHGRLLAAQKLSLAEVPAVVLEGLSEPQKQALRIADNKLALNAGWDDDLLRTELLDLRDGGFDLALTGFGEDELADLFADRTEGLTDPDDVPEPPAEPISKPGDVWLLGNHRLVCGDATNEVDVSLCLGAVRPHLMVTDPPYGVDYDPDWRNRADRANGKPYGASAIGLVENDTRGDWRDAWALFPGEVIYAWHPPGAMQIEHHAALVAAGFDVRMQIIWAKSHFPIGRGNYHLQHEPCWYAVRNNAHWQGDRKQTTLWQIDKPVKSETGHSAQKPVECMRRPIENNSSPGQAVYDPFVGSGTTIIAAEMTGRVCHAIEISPQYVDVAVLRWQNFTGKTATKPDGTAFGAEHERQRPPTRADQVSADA